jgi:lysozyme
MSNRYGGGLAPGLLAGAAIAALLLYSKQSSAADNSGMVSPSNGDPANIPPDNLNYDPSLIPPVSVIDVPNIEVLPVNDPISAFLFMIRSTENPPVSDNERYFRFYGNSIFTDTSDHPVITGEKTGIRLSDKMCRDAGYSPGCVSTAAGAYQITNPTWKRIRAAGVWGSRLPDFSPASQDEAARRLLKDNGALGWLAMGDMPHAIASASRLWASLPGSTAGQPTASYETAVAYFNQFG